MEKQWLIMLFLEQPFFWMHAAPLNIFCITGYLLGLIGELLVVHYKKISPYMVPGVMTGIHFICDVLWNAGGEGLLGVLPYQVGFAAAAGVLGAMTPVLIKLFKKKPRF